MSELVKSSRMFRLALVAMLMSLAVSLSSWVGAQAASVAKDDLPTWRGLVESMPSSGMVGAWGVGGRSFQADSSTEFDQADGPLVVGACAKVRYQTVSGLDHAVEIDSEPASDCGATSTVTSTSEPTASPTTTKTATPTGTPNPGDDVSVKARIDAMPANGLIGAWVIGGVTYTTDANTSFRQDNGPFAVGVCVEVEYASNNPAYAKKIATKSSDDCGGTPQPTATVSPTGQPTVSPTSTRTPTPTGTPGPGDDVSVKARIDAMPASGLIGAWVIGGVAYTTDANTTFRQDKGPFAVGVCVEVEYASNNPSYAKKIATKSSDDCGGSGGVDEGRELYGVIESLPAGGLLGEWRIGGIAFVADTNTVFDQEHVAFAVGVLVEVHFTTDTNGVNRAVKIESKYATGGSGGGTAPGHEGHAFGMIEAIPSGGLIGLWRIGGADYTTTAMTVFQQNDGPFAVGANVKVEYVQDSSGARTAKKIETTAANGNPAEPEHAKVYGFVEQKPVAGYIGQWVVDGVAFTADQRTRFDETLGLLAVGAYAEVEYVPGSDNWIYKLETHVPPGAGPDDRAGAIERIETGARSLNASNAVWVIGGVSYQVTPATVLSDSHGPLTVGSLAAVNSYTDGNGNRIATQIRGLTLSHRFYLPVLLVR